MAFRNENISSRHGSSKSSRDKDVDYDWIRHTNARSLLADEQQHILRRPVIDHGFQKRLSKYNGVVNRMTITQLDEELRRRHLSTSGELEIRRARLKHHYKAQLTLGCEDPYSMIEQEFEYIAVVDFEATCDNKRDNYPHEIIEFPIVLIDTRQMAIIDKFQAYCRPTRNPYLSDFCTELTGIKQSQVISAPIFPDVLRQVEQWLNQRNLLSSSNKRKCAFATDGPWDFAKFLQLQCRFSSIPYPRWARKWINIRKEFASFYSVQRCGIDKMLTNIGLTFNGRHHSGLDDSINIARIALQLMQDGCILSLNDGIRSKSPQFIDMNSTNNSTHHTHNIDNGQETDDFVE